MSTNTRPAALSCWDVTIQLHDFVSTMTVQLLCHAPGVHGMGCALKLSTLSLASTVDAWTMHTSPSDQQPLLSKHALDCVEECVQGVDATQATVFLRLACATMDGAWHEQQCIVRPCPCHTFRLPVCSAVQLQCISQARTQTCHMPTCTMQLSYLVCLKPSC